MGQDFIYHYFFMPSHWLEEPNGILYSLSSESDYTLYPAALITPRPGHIHVGKWTQVILEKGEEECLYFGVFFKKTMNVFLIVVDIQYYVSFRCTP